MAALAIAGKDLRTELRTKESINASVSFSWVILVLFSFAFDLDREEKLALSGGLLWLVYAFAGALIVNRSFAREVPNDCLDVLIASPAPGWAIFLGKAVACFALLMTVELISLPVFGLFYNINWTTAFFPLLIPMLIGAMEMTTGLLNGNAVFSDIRLLVVFDVIFTSLAIYLIDFI